MSSTEILSDSKDPDDFVVENVPEDDACMFRSVALLLFYNINDVKFSEQLKTMLKHPETNIDKGFLHESDAVRIAVFVQQIARLWIVRNKDVKLDICGGETVENIVKETHYISSIEEYSKLFQIYAGENNYIINSFGKKINIVPRWGSLIEQIAICNLFNIDINVFLPRRKHITEDKIVPSFKLSEGTRFVKYTGITFDEVNIKKDSDDDSGNDDGDDDGGDDAVKKRVVPVFNLLLLDKKKKPHYMALY